MALSPITIPIPDMLSRMQSRILTQFRGSPVLQGVLTALASEVQALMDATVGVMQAFVPFNAMGVQLDAIGRIVGQDRGIAEIEPWFTPDTDYYGHPDLTTPVWVTNAPLTGSLIIDDTTYRNYISAKIYRNFIRSGSITEIIDFVKYLFEIDASVLITGPNQIVLRILPGG